MASFFDRFADRMVTNGWRILPIGPGQKAPQRFIGDEWRGYPEWSQHCDRDNRAFEVASWKRWPGAGIGVACGNVVGIDIDVMDAPVAHRLRDLAREMLGETPLLRVGQAPKALLVYRATEPLSGRKRHPIEILARGQQFVACAIHPVTRQPYEWPEEHPADVDVSSLPAIDQAAALAFADAAYAMVPPELRPKTLIGDAPDRSSWALASDPRGTLAAVTAALRYIPNTDLDGASWIKIGHAIKGALGEGGRELWLDWCRQSSKSGASGTPDTPERRWATMRPTSIGAGTIYYLAEQAGWHPPADLILNATAAEQATMPHPAAELLARFERPPPVANDRLPPAPARPLYRLPAGIIPAGGILGDFVHYAVATAVSPQPFLALGAGLAMLGALAGRRYRTSTDLRSNFYGIGIADSASGKDHARKCLKRLLYTAGLDRYLGGEELPSAAGVLTSLSIHPARVYPIDEFGKFLIDIVNPRTARTQAGVLTMLTKLFTSANDIMGGAEYSDQKATGRPRVIIHEPCASVWGVTVPGPLWAAIEGGLLSDGSMARFLIFLTEVHYPDHNPAPADMEPPPDLVAALQAVARGADSADTGNLDMDVLSAGVATGAYTVPAQPPAADALADVQAHALARLREHEGTYATALFGRLFEHTSKLSMLAAISNDPACPVITPAHVEWAHMLALHCIETLMVEAAGKVADTPAQARVNFVRAIVEAAGAEGMTMTELTRKTQKLETKQRSEAVNCLAESGEVVLIKQDNSKGRPSTIIRCA